MTAITFLLAVMIGLLAGPSAAAAVADGSAAPMLRVETGRHHAMVRRLAVDPAGRWFATVSYDKTVRLWSTADGRPLRVLRPPIGPEFEGALYGIAVTPDGASLAMAGWTAAAPDAWAVYLVDLQAADSGAALRRIIDLPARANALAVSPDGRDLAVAMRGGKGVRVYRLADLSLAWEDAGYGEADCLWVVYAADGRLLTASRLPDSRVRLYQPGGARPIAFVPSDGKDVASAVFDATGGRVAVGYTNTTAIDVLDGATLARQFSPDARGAAGSFNRVAWSADGSFLFAAGMQQRGDRFTIYRWADGGRGAFRTVAPARAWITYLAPTGDGGLLYATAEPAVGAIDVELRPRFDLAPASADFRDLGEAFLLSPDGREVHLSLQSGAKAPARLSLAERLLELDPAAPDDRFTRSVDHATGVTVTDWRQSMAPKLNGAALALARYDESVSYTILPDGGLLLGADWYLYRFDATGRELWRRNSAGPNHAVAATRDGRLAVTAVGDGTLRWYRLEDGVELLAAFLAADGKRWVAWTPEGFFDHAPGGGEELVGWHLDRGRDRLAEFVGVGQLYQRFYRPDLVAKKLAGIGEAEIKAALARGGDAERTLAAGLPPEPAFADDAPPDGALLDRRDQEIAVRLSDAGGGFGRVVFRVNGVAVGEAGGEDHVGLLPRGPGRFDRLYTRLMTLEPGVNRIEIAAYNKDGAVESRKVERIVRVADALSEPPALYILTVGIDLYREAGLRLNFAAGDAAALGRELQQRGRRLFRAIHVVSVRNEQATAEGIGRAFAQVASAAKSHDVFVLYLAGHGVTVDGKYFFLPVETAAANLDQVRETALPQERLEAWLAQVPALKSVILLDTCQSGAFALPARGLAELTAVDKLTRATGRAILAAASREQVAIEGYEGHGVFTHALLAGLRGAAPTRGAEQSITVNDLAQFVADEVRRITRLRFGYEQAPVQNLQGASFPIAVGR